MAPSHTQNRLEKLSEQRVIRGVSVGGVRSSIFSLAYSRVRACVSVPEGCSGLERRKPAAGAGSDGLGCSRRWAPSASRRGWLVGHLCPRLAKSSTSPGPSSLGMQQGCVGGSSHSLPHLWLLPCWARTWPLSANLTPRSAALRVSPGCCSPRTPCAVFGFRAGLTHSDPSMVQH